MCENCSKKEGNNIPPIYQGDILTLKTPYFKFKAFTEEYEYIEFYPLISLKDMQGGKIKVIVSVRLYNAKNKIYEKRKRIFTFDQFISGADNLNEYFRKLSNGDESFAIKNVPEFLSKTLKVIREMITPKAKAKATTTTTTTTVAALSSPVAPDGSDISPCEGPNCFWGTCTCFY
jgi:hypothetical protein